jgi:enterochelin esterase-like enzyme
VGNKKIWLVLLFVFIMINLTIPSFTAAKNPHDPASKTVVETITSKALLKDERPKHHKLTYKIYLPRGYDKKRSEGYPVVYLLHGSEGNENSWDDFFGKLDEMIEKKEIEPFIAVVPAAGNSYWVNSKKYGHYESAVIDDLIPHIDKKYNSIADRSGRFISGYSMGGYGALRYSMVYPDLFSGATLLSPAIQNAEPPATSGAVERGSFGEPYDPALWKANNYPTAINSYVKQPYRVPVYIVSGDDDWNHLSEKEDLPPDAYKYNMEVQAVQLYQELHRKNLFSTDFQKWEDVPSSPAELRIIAGGHGLDVWLKGFQEGLKYMFGKAESPEFSPIYDPDSYSSEKKGTVNTYSLHAPSLIQDETPGIDELKYVVYLPEEYNPTAEKNYPVLYLLHGSYGDEKSWDKFWPILDKMIEEKKIEPVMAVAPVTGNSYWVDSLKYGNMESAFINDLVKKIDKDFKTIPDRNGRGLVGYSMGGYGALRYSLVYPHLFGGTSLLSPAIQAFDVPKTSGAVERGSFGDPFDAAIWDSLNYPKALEAYGQQPFKVPIFIMTGDDDWNHISEKEDLPEDACKYNMEVQAVTSYQFLHRSNVFNRPFDKWEPVPGSPAELRILNGGHGMQVWAAGFEQGLLYMFENGLRAQ